MNRHTSIALSLAASASLIAGAAVAADGGRKLQTQLTGSAEVPGPGDPDGTATVTVNPGQSKICYSITVSNIAPARAAHIHEAPAGSAGPVLVTLLAPAIGRSSDCVTVTRELALEILKNPADYYVNVHNAAFPAGAS